MSCATCMARLVCALLNSEYLYNYKLLSYWYILYYWLVSRVSYFTNFSENRKIKTL